MQWVNNDNRIAVIVLLKVVMNTNTIFKILHNFKGLTFDLEQHGLVLRLDDLWKSTNNIDSNSYENYISFEKYNLTIWGIL